MSVLVEIRNILGRVEKSKKLRNSPAIKPLISRLKNYLSPRQSGGDSTPSSVDVSTGAPEMPQEPTQVPVSALSAEHKRILLELWEMSGGKPEMFVSFISSYPDPYLKQAIRRAGALQSIIRELRQSRRVAGSADPDGFPTSVIPSSNVKGFRYNPKSKSLEVKFHSGSIYKYDGVPSDVYKLFASGSASAKTRGRNRYGAWWPSKTPSVGAAVWQYLRAGGFPYQKLN